MREGQRILGGCQDAARRGGGKHLYDAELASPVASVTHLCAANVFVYKLLRHVPRLSAIEVVGWFAVVRAPDRLGAHGWGGTSAQSKMMVVPGWGVDCRKVRRRSTTLLLLLWCAHPL